MDKLTEQQKRFADEYLVDLNATAAYLRAGYKTSGKAAETSASRLLGNAKVQAYIQRRMAERQRRTEVTQDRVVAELAKIAFSDIKDILKFGTERQVVDRDEDGAPIFGYRQIVIMKDSDEVDGTTISEVKETKEGIQVKREDKVKALELLGKHLGMFKDKVELTGDAGGPVQVVFSPKMQPPG